MLLRQFYLLGGALRFLKGKQVADIRCERTPFRLASMEGACYKAGMKKRLSCLFVLALAMLLLSPMSLLALEHAHTPKHEQALKQNKRTDNAVRAQPQPSDCTWFSRQQERKPGSATLHGDQLQKNAVLNPAPKTHEQKKPQAQSKDESSILHFSYDQEKTTWRPAPSQRNSVVGDEALGLHEEHRLRAHTPLDDSEEIKITAGPELILKEQKHNPSLDSNQPDSELGIGMQFQYGF